MSFIGMSFLQGAAETVADNLRSQRQRLDQLLSDGAKQASVDSKEIWRTRRTDEKEYKEQAEKLKAYGLNNLQIESLLKGGISQAEAFIQQMGAHQQFIGSQYYAKNNSMDGFNYATTGFNNENRNSFINGVFKRVGGRDIDPDVDAFTINELATQYAQERSPDSTANNIKQMMQSGKGITGSLFGQEALTGYMKDKYNASFSAYGGIPLDNENKSRVAPLSVTLGTGDYSQFYQLIDQEQKVKIGKLQEEALTLKNKFDKTTYNYRVSGVKLDNSGKIVNIKSTLLNQRLQKIQIKHSQLEYDSASKWDEKYKEAKYNKLLSFSSQERVDILGYEIAVLTEKSKTQTITGEEEQNLKYLIGLRTEVLANKYEQLETETNIKNDDTYVPTYNNLFEDTKNLLIQSDYALNNKYYDITTDATGNLIVLPKDLSGQSSDIIDAFNRQDAILNMTTYNALSESLTLTKKNGDKIGHSQSANTILSNLADALRQDIEKKEYGTYDEKTLKFIISTKPEVKKPPVNVSWTGDNEVDLNTIKTTFNASFNPSTFNTGDEDKNKQKYSAFKMNALNWYTSNKPDSFKSLVKQYNGSESSALNLVKMGTQQNYSVGSNMTKKDFNFNLVDENLTVLNNLITSSLNRTGGANVNPFVMLGQDDIDFIQNKVAQLENVILPLSNKSINLLEEISLTESNEYNVPLVQGDYTKDDQYYFSQIIRQQALIEIIDRISGKIGMQRTN